MVEYGVTNTGFVTKSYSNISNDIENRLKTLFGNEVDLTPGSPLKEMKLILHLVVHLNLCQICLV
jgi:hypothetical protein